MAGAFPLHQVSHQTCCRKCQYLQFVKKVPYGCVSVALMSKNAWKEICATSVQEQSTTVMIKYLPVCPEMNSYIDNYI